PKVIPSVVALQIKGASGSGVIIDKQGHILTAGHMVAKPDQEVTVILSDGKKLKGKTLGLNPAMDSGMAVITDTGPFPFSEMGYSLALTKGQWCLAFGHPGGFQVGRSPVLRLGRVGDGSEISIRTSCTIVGGDTGGPLVDLKGRVIGVHNRIGPSIASN